MWLRTLCGEWTWAVAMHWMVQVCSKLVKVMSYNKLKIVTSGYLRPSSKKKNSLIISYLDVSLRNFQMEFFTDQQCFWINSASKWLRMDHPWIFHDQLFFHRERKNNRFVTSKEKSTKYFEKKYLVLFDKYYQLIAIIWTGCLKPINCNYFC